VTEEESDLGLEKKDEDDEENDAKNLGYSLGECILGNTSVFETLE